MNKPTVPRCRSGSDGDCIAEDCPQLIDNEPMATGRHCPWDAAWSDYWIAETGDPQGRV